MKKIFKKMNKSFISSMDTFLQSFDQSNTSSPSQKKEIKKHKDISNKRDHARNRSSSHHDWPQD